MQIVESFGKFGMLGVTDASVPPSERLTSKIQGDPFDPQVVAAEQSCSGCGFEQTVVLLSLAAKLTPMSISAININMLDPITAYGLLVT